MGTERGWAKIQRHLTIKPYLTRILLRLYSCFSHQIQPKAVTGIWWQPEKSCAAMERAQPIDWAQQTQADLYCTWPGSQVTLLRPLLAGRDRTDHACLGERHDLSDPNPQVHVLSLYPEMMVIQGYRRSSWEISSSSPGSCLRLLGSFATDSARFCSWHKSQTDKAEAHVQNLSAHTCINACWR